MKKELAPRWDLSVTVLHGELKQSYDFFSQPDLYVTLSMPTASACTLKTKIVDNSAKPVWNETFHFHVYSQLKNILEIYLHEEDIIEDEKCATILFDIGTLTLGKTETKVFVIDDEVQDKIWLEFNLTASADEPSQFLSNGVLLAAPMSIVEVELDKPPSDFSVKKDLLVKLLGAFNENQVIPLSMGRSCEHSRRYHVNKHLDTKIELHVEDESPKEAHVGPFKFKKDFTVTLPVSKEDINLRFHTADSPEEDMTVRLDFDIPPEEKAFLVKRKAVVSRALQKFLNLETPLNATQIPTVALVCSGGSTRAMTGKYGFLKGLQNLGLLDAVSYITSVSGSTWASASLYSDPFWSTKGLDKVLALSQEELSKSTASLFAPRQLYTYRKEVQKREKEGHAVSMIDTWAMVIEYLIFGKKHPGKLSDQRKAVSEGQNPLPIYTAVNTKKDACGCVVPEWCEFTPYEVGFPKYGAFVPAEHFGSQFYMGRVVKKKPETRVSFLLGMWSSVFSANLSQIWNVFTGLAPPWANRLGDTVDRIETDNLSTTLDTLCIRPEASRLNTILNGSATISSFSNFLRGFSLHNSYMDQPGFNACNGTHSDAFPNRLTPMDANLNMVDAGIVINTSYNPVLQAHRRADIILSLDYSWGDEGHHLRALTDTQKYCRENKLPFLDIDFSAYKSQPRREVYVFEDEKNPDAPIVVHFPLVNASYRQFKSPGVKRSGTAEIQDGNIDVSSRSSPYTTKNLTLSPEDFLKLMDLTSYNVMNSSKHLAYAFKKALNKKGLGLPNVTVPSEDGSCAII